MHSKIAATALVLALAACDGGGGGGAAKSIQVASQSPYVEKLKTLSDLNRGLALRRAIHDTGGTCKKVEQSGYQQEYKRLSMWTARCSEGEDWAIYIAANGDVQVRTCKDTAALGLPGCKFEEKAG